MQELISSSINTHTTGEYSCLIVFRTSLKSFVISVFDQVVPGGFSVRSCATTIHKDTDTSSLTGTVEQNSKKVF